MAAPLSASFVMLSAWRGSVLSAAGNQRLVARLRLVGQPGRLLAAGAGQEHGIGRRQQPGAAQAGRIDLVDRVERV